MPTKTTPGRIVDIENQTVDPLAHVNMILGAEGPAPRTDSIALVTEQSAMLSDMMDDLTDLKDFDQLKQAAEAQMAKTASIDPAVEPVKLPPPRSFEHPKQAAPRAPKPADVPDYETSSAARRRRRTGATQAANATPVSLPTGTASTTTALTGDHIARLLGLIHMAGSTVIGPEFAISPESAKEIGDAAMPVLEDFGVHAASRAIHLLMFVSTVAFIEGPLVFTAVNSMRARAAIQQNGTFAYNVGAAQGRYQEADVASAISQATGVMVGNAPE